MSKEIEVGEYIRTKGGYIRKVLEINPYYENNKNISENDYVSTETLKQWKRYQLERIIIKHSKDIIDLIEVGDIVNRKQVTKIFIDPFTKKRRLEIEGIEVNWQGDMSLIYIGNEDIKSIVTHQQFEEMEYKVNE